MIPPLPKVKELAHGYLSTNEEFQQESVDGNKVCGQ